MGNITVLEAILTFLTAMLTPASICVWQMIVIGILIAFRKPITNLLQRLSSVKYGDSEWVFQEADSDVSSVEKIPPTILPDSREDEQSVKIFGVHRFYTDEEIQRIVQGSGLVDKGEKVKGQLLLFQTRKQRTWLVTTNKQLFCLLDDERTRATGKIIQWRMALGDAYPIRAREHPTKTTVGLLRIGVKKNWLYSLSLHPDPGELEAEIETMIAVSEKNSN